MGVPPFGAIYTRRWATNALLDSKVMVKAYMPTGFSEMSKFMNALYQSPLVAGIRLTTNLVLLVRLTNVKSHSTLSTSSIEVKKMS